jgi:hypothetical protein
VAALDAQPARVAVPIPQRSSSCAIHHHAALGGAATDWACRSVVAATP